MASMDLVAAALFFGLLALAGSICFFAVNVRGMLNITVQAPTALLPERVQSTLDAIDAKLTPPQKVVDDVMLHQLVADGVLVAEKSKLRGYDKFNVAREFVLSRLKELNAELPSERDLALRIEAAVAKM